MGFYQDPKTSYSTFTEAGSAVDSIHRQHTHTGGVQGGVREAHSGLDIPAGMHGLHNQLEKSITNPAQILEFLGLTVDTLSMEPRLPLDKLKKICAESRKLTREQTTSAHSLARLLRKMNATTPVIPPAPLFCRHLQISLP